MADFENTPTLRKYSDNSYSVGHIAVDFDEKENPTELDVYKKLVKNIFAGEIKEAKTYKKGEYIWVIDGNEVHLPRKISNDSPIELPDTEEAARAVLMQTEEQRD